MKHKAFFRLALLPLLVTLLWVMNPMIVNAHREGLKLATASATLRVNWAANVTPTPSHPTPTPLPAIYRIEQIHPGMIIGAGVLVLIILIGVLAFSRRIE
jgi:hypothetical protein